MHHSRARIRTHLKPEFGFSKHSSSLVRKLHAAAAGQYERFTVRLRMSASASSSSAQSSSASANFLTSGSLSAEALTEGMLATRNARSEHVPMLVSPARGDTLRV